MPEPLPAAELEGSWREAYGILVDMMNTLGWDELLEVSKHTGREGIEGGRASCNLHK